MPVFVLYLIASLVCSFSRYLVAGQGVLWSEYLSKPLLMPLLAVWFALYAGTGAAAPRGHLYSALFFAWGGDMLLMFAGGAGDAATAQLFFLGGLGSFLVMQLLYWGLYARCRREAPQGGGYRPLLNRRPYLLLPIIAVAAGFYAWAFPNLDTVLRIAVALYAIALSGMVVFALQRYGRTSLASFHAVWIGAAVFMVSDLMIGINRFVVEFPFAGPAIMLTYTAGQGLIVWGLMRHQIER